MPTKRTRSASIVSDRTHMNNEHAIVEASPVAVKPPLPPPPTTGTTKSSASRAKRGGPRKVQLQLQDVASVDGDEGKGYLL